MEFRFLNTQAQVGAMNMAIDEAVFESIATQKSIPTLRLYGWAPPTISIGYFQSLEEEVDLDSCKKMGVDVVRRITGGGAVFHEHEITYSIHIPQSLNLVPTGVLESYEAISQGVILGLKLLGVEAKFVPLNDLIVTQNEAQKKISGNAQTRKNGVILQHGTILLRVDVDKMFALLKVPDEKLKGKLIESIKARVTGLSDYLAREVTFEESLIAIQKGFADAFPNVKFIEGELTQEEKASTELLTKEKYSNDIWNRKR